MAQVSFSQIGLNNPVPGIYVEIDPSAAGAPEERFRTVIIGQRLASGRVAAEVPYLVSSGDAAATAFGEGSMLAGMIAAFRRQAPLAEAWAVALDDAAGATAATRTITVTSAATAAGTIALYVAGRRVAVGIAGGAAEGAIATAINAAVGAATGLPVTSAAAGAVVTLTARQSGLATDLDVRINYQPDEALPPGVALTIATGTAGAGDPDIADALDALGAEEYDLFITPYSAAASMTALETELATRWQPGGNLKGVGISAFRGTSAAAVTYGNARNSQYSCVPAVSDSPTPTYEIAADVGGLVARAAEADPARPFQDLPLLSTLAPSIASRYTVAEQRTLLSDGMATLKVDRGGTPRVQRLVTTWQTDASFMDLNTPLTLSFLANNIRGRIMSRYGRHKLGDDGARTPPGQAIITPRIGRAEAVNWFRDMEDLALVENAEQFKAGLVVARNQSDRNRLDWHLPVDIINQFRVGAIQIAFRL